MIIAAFFGNVSGLFLDDPRTLAQLPLYKAFSSPEFFYFGIVAHITTSATALFDIFLDFFTCGKVRPDVEANEGPDSWSERLFFSMINMCTGIIFLGLRDNINAPYIYACVYNIQCLAGFGAVLLMCNKLEPSYFPFYRIIATYLSLCLTDILAIIGVGHSIAYWSNMMSFLTAALFISVVFGKILVPWLRSLTARNLSDSPLTINEMCCLWYFLSSLTLKFMVPIIISLSVEVQWSRCTTVQINTFVYSLALLGIIVCNISGRLARSIVYTERCLLADIRRIIRYLSHEVRSPLNIISSAIGFMDIDMAALPPSPEKASVADSLVTMRQAAHDILKTMNEMLQMETINSGSLSLDLQMVPCGEVMEIIQRSGVTAREKGVQFSVQEFLSRGQGTECVDGSSRSIHDLESLSTMILEDSRKAIQDSKGAAARVQQGPGSAKYRSAGHAVIEVVDTGVGISPEDQSKVFGAFTQFRANELQGGGGTGLGLWISQEIIKTHGSVIHFRSEGLGKGTTFFFILPMYVLNRQLGPTSLWQPQEQALLGSRRDDTVPAKLIINTEQSPGLNGQDPDSTVASSTPVAVDSSTHSLLVAATDSHVAATSRSIDLKILVVDDSKANLKFLVRHLRQAAAQIQLQQSYQVVLEIAEEMDGSTAVTRMDAAALEGRPFQMVFMDNTMTEMHGPQAARCMREKGFAGIILGVTGNVLQKDVAEFIQAGADHVMPKPITTADVVGMIQKMIAMEDF
eukprot:gene30629-39902_t